MSESTRPSTVINRLMNMSVLQNANNWSTFDGNCLQKMQYNISAYALREIPSKRRWKYEKSRQLLKHNF